MPGKGNTHGSPSQLVMTACALGASSWVLTSSCLAAAPHQPAPSPALTPLSLQLVAMGTFSLMLIALFSLYSWVLRARHQESLSALRESETRNLGFVEALRESEEKFRALAQSTPTAVMLYQDDTWVYANPAAESMCGYALAELKGMRLRDFVPPDYQDFVQEQAKNSRQGAAARRFEFKIVSKQGRELWVDLSGASVMLNGRPAGIISFMDITQRKASEQACQESEARYRNILENIEEGYVEVDLKGCFTFFNNSLCRILGLSREKLMGMDFRELVEPAPGRRILTSARMMHEGLISREIISLEVVRGDKTTGTLEMSLSLVRDFAGRPAGFRGIVRDVTERRRLETQLLQAQKLEAVGTLAGGIAHDFNNLLMAIQGNTSLLSLEIPGDHPCRKRVLQIEQCVESGSSLTRQLLGFARGGKYEVRPLNVNALIQRTSEMFEHTRKELKVHRKLQEGSLNVEVDKGQIEQVLVNLYVNAWQAMPSGGELFLETSLAVVDRKLALSYDVRPGRYVRISVADTGVGMDEETMRRIFEPFFTTKEVSRGTGLGLASAYGIVRNHGGFIAVSSAQNSGSTFEVFLPASDKGAPSREDGDRLQALTGCETILLVDDERMIVDAGTELLTGLGYRVMGARGGNEAVETFSRERDAIDLVILDMIMPGVGGSETFDRIMQVRPDAKVLLSSGYSMDSTAADILKRGCSGFIQKPFDLATLSRKIREVLDPLQP